MSAQSQRISLPDARPLPAEDLPVTSPAPSTRDAEPIPDISVLGPAHDDVDDSGSTMTWEHEASERGSTVHSENNLSTVNFSEFSEDRKPSGKRKRSVLTESQRKEAAIMRKLGSCENCKRRKVRCDPSHVRHNDPRWSEATSVARPRPEFHRRPPSPRLLDHPFVKDIVRRTKEDASQQLHQHYNTTHSQEKTGLGQTQTSSDCIGSPAVPKTGSIVRDPGYSMAFTPVNQTADLLFSQHTSRTESEAQPGSIDDLNFHALGIEDLAEDLQKAAKTVFPRDSRYRYTSVHVLLLRWEGNRPLSILSDELAKVFSDDYHYDVSTGLIPVKSTSRWLTRRILDFIDLEDDSPNTLKILWYGGHSYADTSGTECIWSNGLPGSTEATVASQGPLVLLTEAQSDVLMLLDSHVASIGSISGKGLTEILAAGQLHARIIPGNDLPNFTQALTMELQRATNTLAPVYVPQLHARMFASMGPYRLDKGHHFTAPVHLALSAPPGLSRSIQLPSAHDRRVLQQRELLAAHSVFGARSAPQTNSPGRKAMPENGPELLLSIKLHESFLTSNVSSEEFAEWLRAVPAAVQEVKVEASYTSA